MIRDPVSRRLQTKQSELIKGNSINPNKPVEPEPSLDRRLYAIRPNGDSQTLSENWWIFPHVDGTVELAVNI